jgi:hypothetical protein
MSSSSIIRIFALAAVYPHPFLSKTSYTREAYVKVYHIPPGRE